MNTRALRSLAIVGLLLVFIPAVAQLSDPTKEGAERLAYRSDNAIVNSKVADFLIRSADGRLEAARLAVRNAGSPKVRAYGFSLIREQSLLMIDLKELAAAKKVRLPESTTLARGMNWADLAGRSGKDFDDRFIKTIISQHERDLKMFRDFLSYSNDPDVSAFVRKYIPIIQAQLNDARAIRKSQK